jgi:hypothetical protein
VKCSASTASGAPCKSSALHGGTLCVAHAGVVRHDAKLTPEIIERLVALLAAGNYINLAVAAAGVPRSTFYDWWARGDLDGTDSRDASFRAMRARLERAKAEGEARNVAVIANAARENWQAAAWILERGSPERWARPSQRTEDDRASAPPETARDAFTEVDELAQRRRTR